ncbi:MAG: hypothetical protein GC200_05305 [Tepidisphaera sp.]|nr:hypothetical protein [Tepidisphaera sp.]
MAIDPMLYEKLSGRKGDPRDRLGQVLADDAKAKQSRERARDRAYSGPRMTTAFKAKAAFGAAGALVLMVVLLGVRGCS